MATPGGDAVARIGRLSVLLGVCQEAEQADGSKFQLRRGRDVLWALFRKRLVDVGSPVLYEWELQACL